MKNKDYFTLGIMVGLFVALIILGCCSLYALNNTDEPSTIIVEKQIQSYTPRFLNIANNFSLQHNYTPNKYDCRKYTIDLYQLYEREGIISEPVIGWNMTDSHDYAHAFIKVTVYLEPQTGHIIENSERYKYIYNYDTAMQQYRDDMYKGLEVK